MPEPLAAAQKFGMPRAIGEVLQQIATQFRAAGLDTPARDARLLVSAALGLSPVDAIARPETPVPAEAVTRIEAFAHRRLAREPVSRILGMRQFYGLDLEIGPATLDPRPETETLVDAALELVRGGLVPGRDAPRILDLGTGSGAIVITLLNALPAAQGLATDIDEAALSVARRNALRHGVENRVQFAAVPWLGGLVGPFDLIVSNPPYIPSCQIDGLDAEVAFYDPRRALDGGMDGLEAYRRIIGSAGAALAPGGWLALEIGAGQENDVSRLAAKAENSFSEGPLRQWLDLAGLIRCVAFQARP